MAQISGTLIFPTFDEVVGINRKHLTESGQKFVPPNNLRKPGSLSWVLDAIQYPIFGCDPYPTFTKKAAELTWIITRGHIFWDGCKRTGISVLFFFAKLNGYELDLAEGEIVEVALSVASDPDYTIADLERWIDDSLC